jgi:hypothetical protein
MTLFAATVALHVMVAVVGIGLLGAIPIAASLARRRTLAPPLEGGLLEMEVKALP